MEIPKTFDPSAIEEKWYNAWMDKGFFNSKPDEREAFTIVMPPPNVTGVLHMGHALNNTIQDILIRRARMQGFNACWVPGTDHASIATEAKVVNLLLEKGLKKGDISREEFLVHAWEWKEKYGGIILQQLKKLGASCDWSRTAFTMDADYYASVIKVFVDLFDKGYIYRGVQMVNWDPQARTALSDEEVIFKEVHSKLYYVQYQIADQSTVNSQQSTDKNSKQSEEYITIATTRPETILGDTAICVNPTDERYFHLHGKKAIVPLINRVVPIIVDEYVEKDFGTGALKVTPAHDKNDYELGKTHGLATVDVLDAYGKMSEAAQLYIGKDRFAARKLIIKDLEDAGALVKTEEIQNNVGFSERTDAVIEPRLSNQWFCRMTDLASPALEAVMGDEVELYPAKFKNVYRHWMENIRDWCISRQLWWGHRIPAYFLPDGTYVVAESAEAALIKAIGKTGNNALTVNDLKQEEDVLDTRFSSWLWPITVFNGILEPENEDINYYYPTQVLVSGHDIIFFWIARMIMSGYEYRKAEPFNEVYFTGMVRDKQGRKMSKSLGNSPDLLELISRYGADAVRFGVIVSSPAGNDLLFDEKLCDQGRNFSNKIWNAMRLVKGWELNDMIRHKSSMFNEKPVRWFENKLFQVQNEIDDYFEEFRLSEALTAIYKLIWHDFCSNYLEMIKPGPDSAMDSVTYEHTLRFFEELMKLIHPFMPFISEEIWQTLRERKSDDCCIVAQLPELVKPDKELLKNTERVIEAISWVRYLRNESGISPKTGLDLYIKSENPMLYRQWEPIIRKIANINHVSFVRERLDGAKSFTIKTDEFYIPVQAVSDPAAEKEKMQKELEYTRGFLNSVSAKLANERFVQNAKKEVIETELQKKADAEAKIKLLEESLSQLS
jgi:valyl-tRNA synthetase